MVQTSYFPNPLSEVSSFFYLSTLCSKSRPRAAAGVSSDVTGGRPVFTSAAVGGGAPGPPKRSGGGNREGAHSPARSCARSDQAGSLGLRPVGPTPRREPQKRLHDPYITLLWLFCGNNYTLPLVNRFSLHKASYSKVHNC